MIYENRFLKTMSLSVTYGDLMGMFDRLKACGKRDVCTAGTNKELRRKSILYVEEVYHKFFVFEHILKK